MSGFLGLGRGRRLIAIVAAVVAAASGLLGAAVSRHHYLGVLTPQIQALEEAIHASAVRVADLERQTLISREIAAQYRPDLRPEAFISTPTAQGVLDFERPAAAVDVALLIETASGAPIDIPDGGAYLDRVIQIEGEVALRGGRVAVSPEAGFVVPEGSSLSLEDAQIHILGQVPETPGAAFLTLLGGSFSLVDSRVLVKIGSSPRVVAARAPDQSQQRRPPLDLNDVVAPYALISIAGDAGTISELRLVGNELRAAHPYAVSLLTQSNHSGTVSGMVNENLGIGFFGGVYVLAADGLAIRGNEFVAFARGSVFVAGRDISVTDNALYYSGAGIVGDGITVADASRVVVSGNLIFAGTCYGIWLRATEAREVVISGNVVISGITHGVAVSPATEDARISDVLIHDNLLANNAGFGIALQTGSRIEIVSNHLHHNAVGFPGEVAIVRGVDFSMEDNTLSVAVDPGWAADADFFRSNFRLSASVDELVHFVDPG